MDIQLASPGKMNWETLIDLLKTQPVFRDLRPFARTLYNLGVMDDEPTPSLTLDEREGVSKHDSGEDSGEVSGDPHSPTFQQRNPPSRRGSKEAPGGPRDLPVLPVVQQHQQCDPARSTSRRESVRTGRPGRENPGRHVPMVCP